MNTGGRIFCSEGSIRNILICGWSCGEEVQRLGNYRCRQLEKCYYRLQKNPDVFATVRQKNGFNAMFIIPQNELEVYKEKFGESLNVWDWMIVEHRKPN